jgi:hypothetical protein
MMIIAYRIIVGEEPTEGLIQGEQGSESAL